MPRKIVLVVSLAAGVVAAVLTNIAFSAKEAEVAKAKRAINERYGTIDAVVFSADVPAGTVLSTDDLGSLKLPALGLRGQAVEEYLREYPDIAVVLDVHRDALGSDGVVYKTMAEEDGTVASQIMLLAGSDESGLEHPNWRSNLALALYLQEAVGRRHPSLMRPVALVPQRYNQHLTPGSLILEVGSSGNTLQEALAAIRLFADAAAPALLALADRAE